VAEATTGGDFVIPNRFRQPQQCTPRLYRMCGLHIPSSEPMMWCHHVLAAVGLLLIVMSQLVSVDRTAGTPPVLEPVAGAEILQQRFEYEGSAGTLVICGGGRLVDASKRVFADAVLPGRPVVVIPTASADAKATVGSAVRWLGDVGISEIDSVESSGDAAADLESLAKSIRLAGGVWISGGRQSRLADAYAGTIVERELKALLDRGGVIGGTSAGAAILSGVMIASGSDQPNIATGLDLAAGTIIDQHFAQRKRIARLRSAVACYPDRVGIGIDEATAVVIKGRNIKVIGDGQVTIVMAKANGREAIEQVVPAGAIADLTQLRRAARWRCSGVDPGQPCFGLPEVSSGSLVIVGGGGMSKPIVDRFIELAGGKHAKIVVLPTAVPRAEAFRARVPGFLARADVATVTLLPQSRSEEIADERFQQALRDATGIWFDGGRQWNFVDAYENTHAIELFHDVLKRGGVIGGSSAGATIQGEYLVRGHPLGNTVMMAEGYERGFAFLPGVAIDQHFSQRRRHADLLPVIERHPRLLGIGIDEGTALVVTGSRAEVLGEHAVHFLRADPSNRTAVASSASEANVEADGIEESQAISGSSSQAASGEPALPNPAERYVVVPAGKIIDLKTLQICDP
jgi:cyanophycinase